MTFSDFSLNCFPVWVPRPRHRTKSLQTWEYIEFSVRLITLETNPQPITCCANEPCILSPFPNGPRTPATPGSQAWEHVAQSGDLCKAPPGFHSFIFLSSLGPGCYEVPTAKTITGPEQLWFPAGLSGSEKNICSLNLSSGLTQN